MSLLEKKIIYENVDYNLNLHEKSILNNGDKEDILKDLVFYKVIELINESRSYMFGPEKAVTARFISKHYIDVYKILKEIIKKEK